MAAYSIRLYGDPVLKQRAAAIENIDGTVKALADAMLDSMYEVHGLGLAAPQVGVQKRLFVYDLYEGEGPKVIVNPVLAELSGEWTFDEGCLSLPGLYFPITRPKEVHLTGYDLDGNEVSIEADEILARAFQHELDHLEGTLLLEHLDTEQRKAALRELRQRSTV
jgi:peptide deformylase